MTRINSGSLGRAIATSRVARGIPGTSQDTARSLAVSDAQQSVTRTRWWKPAVASDYSQEGRFALVREWTFVSASANRGHRYRFTSERNITTLLALELFTTRPTWSTRKCQQHDYFERNIYCSRQNDIDGINCKCNKKLGTHLNYARRTL